MHPIIRNIALLGGIMLLSCLAACEDDQPIQPQIEDPPIVDTTDVRDTTDIRIDSIDAREICPPNELTIFGKGFAQKDLRLEIGGQLAVILEQTDTQIKTEVPWDIENGEITIFNESNEIETSFRSLIETNCVTFELPALEVRIPDGLAGCTCDYIEFSVTLAEAPPKTFYLYSYAGDTRVNSFPIREKENAGYIRIPPRAYGEVLRVVDNRGNEVYRSTDVITPGENCRGDYSAYLANITLPSTYIQYKSWPESGVDRRIQSTLSLDSFRVQPFIGCTSSEVNRSDTFYSGDTLVFQSRSNFRDYPLRAYYRSVHFKRQIRVIQSNENKAPQYVELRLMEEERHTRISVLIAHRLEQVNLRIDPAAFSDRSLELNGAELAKHSECDYNRNHYNSSRDGMVLVHREVATSASLTIDPNAVLRIQLGNH